MNPRGGKKKETREWRKMQKIRKALDKKKLSGKRFRNGIPLSRHAEGGQLLKARNARKLGRGVSKRGMLRILTSFYM